jgi:membrane protein implicated in regulation of membrane protease activity
MTLHAGERVWLRATPSTNLVLASLAVGFVLLVAMSIVVGTLTDLATGQAVSFVILVLIVALLVAAYLVTERREYVLTSNRACVGTGLRSKWVSAIAIGNVRDVRVEQSRWQRWVDIGDLRFVTDDGTTVRFAHVDDPAALHEHAVEIVEGGEPPER